MIVKSLEEFDNILDEVQLESSISCDVNRADFVETVELIIELLNNKYFNENSENAFDDPEAIVALQNLKNGNPIADGDYFADCVDALMWYLECADKQHVFGTEGWKQILGWN